MSVNVRTVLAVLFVAAMPLRVGAQSLPPASEPPRVREIRSAEREARTPGDHLRLAAWYQSEARKTESKLTEEEALVKYWAQQPGMANRTKTPNPYWNAQALVRLYREKMRNATELAATHLKLAESLQASLTR